MEPPDAPSSSASSQQTSSVTSPRGLPFHALISPRRRANAAQRSPKQRSHAPILGSNDGRALTLQPGPRASSRSRQARSGHTWTVASPSLPPLSTARQRRTDDRFVLGSQRLGQPSAISAEPFSPMVIDSSEGSSDEEGAGQTLLGRLPRHPLDRSQSPQPSTSDIRLPSYDEDADENNGFPLSSPPTSMVTDQSPLDIRKKGSGLHDVGGTVFQSTLQGTPTRRPVSTASPPSSSYYASWLGLDLHPHSRFSNFRQSSGPDLVHRMRANALGASTLALPASLVNRQHLLQSFACRRSRGRWVLRSLYGDEDNYMCHDTMQGFQRSMDTDLVPPLWCSYAHSAGRGGGAYGSAREWLAVGGEDPSIRLVDTSVSSEEYAAHVRQHAFAGKGTSLYSGWPTRTVFKLPASVFNICWRPDDRILAAATGDYQVNLFDVETGSLLGNYAGAAGTSRALEFDPHSDGRLFSSAGRDGAIHLFDTRLPPQRSSSVSSDELSLPCHSPVVSLWRAHSGTSAICTRDGAKVPRPPRLSPPGVTGLRFASAQPHALITSCARDTTLRKWDLRAPAQDALQTPLEDDTHATFESTMTTSEDADTFLADEVMRLGGGAEPFVNLSQDPSEAARALDRRTAKGWQSRVARSRSGVLRIAPRELSDVRKSSRRSGSSPGLSGLTLSEGMVYASATDGRVYGASLEQLDAPLSVSRAPGQGFTHPLLKDSTLLTPLAASPTHGLLAVGCTAGDIVLFDTLGSRSRQNPTFCDKPFQKDSYSHVLPHGHEKGYEVNSISWADGAASPTFASVADDLTVRVWRADQAEVELAAQEPKDEGWA